MKLLAILRLCYFRRVDIFLSMLSLSRKWHHSRFFFLVPAFITSCALFRHGCLSADKMRIPEGSLLQAEYYPNVKFINFNLLSNIRLLKMIAPRCGISITINRVSICYS